MLDSHQFKNFVRRKRDVQPRKRKTEYVHVLLYEFPGIYFGWGTFMRTAMYVPVRCLQRNTKPYAREFNMNPRVFFCKKIKMKGKKDELFN